MKASDNMYPVFMYVYIRKYVTVTIIGTQEWHKVFICNRKRSILPTYTQYTAAALSSRVLHVIEPRMGFMTLLWFRRRNCTFLFNVFEIPSLQISIFLGKSLLYCVCGDLLALNSKWFLSRNTIRHFHQADKSTFSIFKNISFN